MHYLVKRRESRVIFDSFRIQLSRNIFVKMINVHHVPLAQVGKRKERILKSRIIHRNVRPSSRLRGKKKPARETVINAITIRVITRPFLLQVLARSGDDSREARNVRFKPHLGRDIFVASCVLQISSYLLSRKSPGRGSSMGAASRGGGGVISCREAIALCGADTDAPAAMRTTFSECL